jgi:hypothetical protein
VDKLDTWLYKGLRLARWLCKKLQPIITFLFKPAVRAIKYIRQHWGRIYNVIVTSVLICLVVFLIFQRFFQNAIAAAGDFTFSQAAKNALDILKTWQQSIPIVSLVFCLAI